MIKRIIIELDENKPYFGQITIRTEIMQDAKPKFGYVHIYELDPFVCLFDHIWKEAGSVIKDGITQVSPPAPIGVPESPLEA